MRAIAIDANLLILLIVGLVDRALIAAHKRTRNFEAADFDLLLEVLGKYDQIVVTPNVLTEASNLVGQVAEPRKTAVMVQLATLVGTQREEYRASAEVVAHPDFVRLGLSDCALLKVTDEGMPLLTADLDLYLAALRTSDVAVNFNHLRQERLLEG
jgi:hypothetical protein